MPEFASISHRLRPPAVKLSEKDFVTTDVILEFRQIPIGSDVRNHEVIGEDYFPAPFASFDFLDRKLVFLGQLFDPFPFQHLKQLGVGGIDGVSLSHLNHRFGRFIAVQQVTAERCGVPVPVRGEACR